MDDQQKHEEHALLHGAPDEGRTEAKSIEDPGEEPDDETDAD